MTPREQDAVIAEWCEPKEIRISARGSNYSARGFWHFSTHWAPLFFSKRLNDMASAEAVVKERELWKEYAHELMITLLGHDDNFSDYLQAWEEMDDGTMFMVATATATAAQRAEAMVRMIRGLEGER